MFYTTQETSSPEPKLVPEGRHLTTFSVPNINAKVPDKLMITVTGLDSDTLEPFEKAEFLPPIISPNDGFRVFADLISIVEPNHSPEGDFDILKLDGIKGWSTYKHIIGTGKHAGKMFSNLMMVEPYVEAKKA